MTDKELLSLAAKAAGIRVTVEDDEYYKTRKFFGLWLVYADEPSEYARRYWNPLTDDGDALRLGHKLRLFTDVMVWPSNLSEFRRAIVRAAAEIGKDKP